MPTCNGKPATIVNTPGIYRYQGTTGDDVAVLTGTYDDFTGHGGDDTVCVTHDAPGDPYLAHTVVLGDGDDWVQSAGGNDVIDVGGGNDTSTIAGFEGLAGSSADDVITGTDAPETFENSGGHDEVYGLGGDDTFTQPAHYKCLQGLGGMVSHGGAGDDTFQLGAGDTGYGDSGDDTASFGYRSVFHGGAGADRATNLWPSYIPDAGEVDPCPVKLGRMGGNAYGDSGRDTLAFRWDGYHTTPGGVRVHLGEQVAQSRAKPHDGSAHVEGFEVVSGSPNADLIYGGPGLDTCTHVEHRTSCSGPSGSR